jgi:hypothetical protein
MSSGGEPHEQRLARPSVQALVIGFAMTQHRNHSVKMRLELAMPRAAPWQKKTQRYRISAKKRS